MSEKNQAKSPQHSKSTHTLQSGDTAFGNQALRLSLISVSGPFLQSVPIWFNPLANSCLLLKTQCGITFTLGNCKCLRRLDTRTRFQQWCVSWVLRSHVQLCAPSPDIKVKCTTRFNSAISARTTSPLPRSRKMCTSVTTLY